MAADPTSVSGAQIGPARSGAREREPSYRYGLVFALILAQAVFLIAAPSARWSRGVSIVIGGSALIVALTTARARESTRRDAVAIVAVGTVAVVTGILIGYTPGALTFGVGVVGAAAVPLVTGRGLFRLLRERGVTLQAVAGALTIYLCLGLVFAWVISLVADVSSTPYFAQHTDVTLGDRVYFSFATLTTTGYGDFSPATQTGHAVAVLEMLTGQLYLVTVIGLMIGNYGGGRGRGDQ